MPPFPLLSHENNRVCAICCEENKPNLISLTKCSHKSCADCLTQWIEKVEATGQDSLPGCLFCRVELTLEETQEILGRPYQAASAQRREASTAVPDDLTRQWLTSHSIQPCPRCGAWIEKMEGGCDMMECLCGYRFCFGCGAQGARCDCTPETHSFWDNVLDRNAGESVAVEAPVEEGGQVDLVAHFEKRKKQERDDKIRRNRAWIRTKKARECRSVDEVNYSAKWLFLPTRKAMYKMLDQLRAQRQVSGRRQQQRGQASREERDLEELIATARWLFLPVVGAFQLLEQQKEGSLHQRRRGLQTHRVMEETSLTPLDCSARWLFCNDQTGFRMRKKQLQANRVHQKRQWKRSRQARQEDEEEVEPDQMIASGRWLFRKKTAQATRDQLKGLFRRQSAAERTRTLRRWDLDGFFYAFGLGPCYRIEEWELERENVVNIRLLYHLGSDKERVKERKEVGESMFSYGL